MKASEKDQPSIWEFLSSSPAVKLITNTWNGQEEPKDKPPILPEAPPSRRIGRKATSAPTKLPLKKDPPPPPPWWNKDSEEIHGITQPTEPKRKVLVKRLKTAVIKKAPNINTPAINQGQASESAPKRTTTEKNTAIHRAVDRETTILPPNATVTQPLISPPVATAQLIPLPSYANKGIVFSLTPKGQPKQQQSGDSGVILIAGSPDSALAKLSTQQESKIVPLQIHPRQESETRRLPELENPHLPISSPQLNLSALQIYYPQDTTTQPLSSTITGGVPSIAEYHKPTVANRIHPDILLAVDQDRAEHLAVPYIESPDAITTFDSIRDRVSIFSADSNWLANMSAGLGAGLIERWFNCRVKAGLADSWVSWKLEFRRYQFSNAVRHAYQERISPGLILLSSIVHRYLFRVFLDLRRSGLVVLRHGMPDPPRWFKII